MEAENLDTSEQDKEIEEKARAVGHVPLDEFRGDPNRWVDAKTYLERAEKDMGMLKSNNHKLHDEIKDMKKTFMEFKEFHEKSIEQAKQDGYKQARTEIIEKQRQAVEDGDTQTFEALESKKTDLDKQYYETQRVEPKADTPPPDPTFEQFKQENPWIDTDMELTALADSLATYVKSVNPSLYGKAFYDKVAEEVKKARPEKFSNPNRDLPSAVDEGGYRSSATPKTKRTFNDLPKEAKEQAERFEKRGFCSRDEYLANYKWD